MQHSELYDRFWGPDGINLFGHPSKLDVFMKKTGIIVDEVRKEIHVGNTSLHELATFLTDYPEGEYKILVHESNEKADIKG